jgi:NAD(P)-dependent dehydrogenase (short-subunit alcohol dehydrogenase family)
MSIASARPLAGRVAVVTGSGRGIGRSTALRLAAAGAKLVVNDLGSDLDGHGTEAAPAEAVADEIRNAGGEAIANVESVATMQGARNVIEAALDTFHRIDILVNNAGVIRPGLIFDATEEDFDLTIGVHVKGTFATTRHAAPHFRAQNSGVIVNVGSDAGLGNYGNSLYAAAKEAIAGFTRSIARELGPYNARCNMIRPWASTRMGQATRLRQLIEECEQQHGFSAVGDLWFTEMPGQEPPGDAPDEEVKDIGPDQVAGFVTWLCTDQAAHLNGETFRVKQGELGLMSDPAVVRSVFHDGAWDLATLNDPALRAYLFRDLKDRFRSKTLTHNQS